ncbi:MAG: phosphodiester glycosidase family protein [Clostridia bacterium]|nr:phosphodiester glycosidase family protein [Clostridia bacterium]
MKKHFYKRILSLALALTMLLAACPLAQARRVTPPDGKILISQTDYTLSKGVTESKIILNSPDGDAQAMCYMTTIAPEAEVAFKASYAGYYAPGTTAADRAASYKDLKWGMARTTDQAKAYEQTTGESVLFATNGDYYNMQTAQPLGYLIMEGNVIQTGNQAAPTEPFFAMLKDGSFTIREAGSDISDVVEAVSGPIWLVRNGQNVCARSNGDLMPRNCIGVTADGGVVACVADGRQAPYSVGLTLWELSEILLDQGVVDAIYLDGGGSATSVTKREGTDELVVRNSPSDGPERTVASALLFVSTAVKSGEFDHASVSPTNEVYTPGSSVQFSAIGVDAAGGAAELPEGLTWSVAEEAGAINADGLFTAKEGFAGTVTVELKDGDKVVGSSEIVIADIDDIYFTGTSISLDFDADSDLGLNVRSEGREINYKDGDFAWEIIPDGELTPEQIGTFNGNIFHSAKAEDTLTALVKVSYTNLAGETITAEIKVEIGKMPVTIFDYEENEDGRQTAAHFHWGKGEPNYGVYTGDYDTLTVVTNGGYPGVPATYGTFNAPYTFTGNYDTAVPASGIFNANGYDYYLWPNGALSENGCGELKVSSRAEGAQVRSGDYSLELNYDYASYNGASNANYYLRTTELKVIEGYPTKLGVWIYAPEGTANYVLACDIAAWNGSAYATKSHYLYYDMDGKTYYTNEDGIKWTGWMHCYADLTDVWSLISEEHPLILRPGEGMFWLCYQPGKGLGGRYNGTLYFDDYRLEYGTNLDDYINPTITSVTLNGEEIAEDGSTVITTNAAEFGAEFFDPESQNRTGVDASATTFFIDGKNIALDGDDVSALTRTTLSNGVHTFMVQISDGAGNTVSVTRTFTVACEDNTNPSAQIAGRDVIAIGSTYTLNVTVDGEVTTLDALVLDINSDFGLPTVNFAEGVTGTYEYTPTGYRKAKLTIHIEGEALTGDVAQITFNVPGDLDAETDFFTYRVNAIDMVDAEENTYSDAQGLVRMTLSAYYTLQIGLQLPGKTCDITVFDIDNLPAADVTVSLNGTAIGTTDENGVLVTDAMSEMLPGETFILTASSDLGLSFEAKGTVMNFAGDETGVPYTIYHNAVSDAATEKNITWFTNPNFTEDCSYIRLMTEANYNKYIKRGPAPDTAYTAFRAETELLAFPTSKNASRISTITLEGLEPDTLYYYWIGDGTEDNWSGNEDGTPLSFRTAKEDQATTTFFVVGDTQMSGNPANDEEPIALLTELLSNIAAHNVDFGIQTGDFVDNGGSFNHWEELFGVFGDSDIASNDMIHVLGNHEYYGDFSGSVANKVLELPDPDFYSVEYNDVYVAVINNSADLNDAAAWLVEDAAKSDCTWKVMTVHQPAYYTNLGGGSEKFNEILAPAADAADIDVVFSGHDHSYARTEQMTGGELDDFGCAWFICGDLGEKSRSLQYTAVDTPEFHFASISQEYDALAIIAQAEGLEMTVTSYDAAGNIIDSVTYDKNPCKNGHNYIWSSEAGSVICTMGGEEAEVEDGWIENENGEQVYLVENQPLTGWQVLDETVYNFNDDGTIAEQFPLTDECFIYDRTAEKVINRYTGEDAYDGYNGWTEDTEGGKVFIIGGTFKTGWFIIGEEIFHFDEETGYAHEFAVYEDVPTDCEKMGHLHIECSCGETYDADHSMPTGHSYAEGVLEDGTTGYICELCGKESKYNIPFIDVNVNSWYAPDVEYVYLNGLFSGISATKYAPHAEMSRSMIVNVLWRLAGEPDEKNVNECQFPDCKLRFWYTAAINWAAANGIVSGYTDGNFGPDDTLTREQMVVIIYNYVKYTGKDVSVDTEIPATFTDKGRIHSYAVEAMTWAYSVGLIQGKTETTLAPGDICTRCEVAAVIHRLCENILKEAPVIE